MIILLFVVVMFGETMWFLQHMMHAITIYTKKLCPHCLNAKSLLDTQGLKYTEIHIQDHKTQQQLVMKSGVSTVPQIFIDGLHIGGYHHLYKLMQQDW